MPARRLPWWAFASLGALTPLSLGLIGTAVTPSHRWLGIVPGDNVHSQSRLLVTLVVLALLPLGTLWLRAGRRRAALLCLWLGVLLGVFGAAAAAPGAHFGGVLGQIAVYAILVLTGMPLLVGALCQALLEEGIALVRKRGGSSPALPTSAGAA